MLKHILSGTVMAAALLVPGALHAMQTAPDGEDSAQPPTAQPVPHTVPKVVHTSANPRGSDEPPVQYPAPQSADDPVPPSLPSDPEYLGEPYKGALTPPPPEAFGKEYPLCSATVQDSCRNPAN